MHAAPLDIPVTATVSFLKRTISRTLGGYLEPLKLYNSSLEMIAGPSVSAGKLELDITSLGVAHNSMVVMVRDRITGCVADRCRRDKDIYNVAES